MKSPLLFLVLFFQWSVQAQIISSTTEATSKKNKTRDSSSIFYADFQRFNTHPNLSQNTSFLTVPLGERANETALKLWSYQFGLCSPISKHLSFDGGLAIIQTGEQYSWKSTATDSSYTYATKYRYFGMPLQVKFQTGKDLVFFIGIQLHFKSSYGLRFSLNYRYQLTNSYGPYQYFKHYSSGIGGGIALTRKL